MDMRTFGKSFQRYPAAPSFNLDDPQIVHNDVVYQAEHPTAGALRQVRPAPRFSATPASPGPPAPLEGEHTDDILRELGYPPERIAALHEAGVIRGRS